MNINMKRMLSPIMELCYKTGMLSPPRLARNHPDFAKNHPVLQSMCVSRQGLPPDSQKDKRLQMCKAGRGFFLICR